MSICTMLSSCNTIFYKRISSGRLGQSKDGGRLGLLITLLCSDKMPSWNKGTRCQPKQKTNTSKGERTKILWLYKRAYRFVLYGLKTNAAKVHVKVHPRNIKYNVKIYISPAFNLCTMCTSVNSQKHGKVPQAENICLAFGASLSLREIYQICRTDFELVTCRKTAEKYTSGRMDLAK